MSTNGALTTLLNAPGAAGTTFEVAANTGAWFVAGPAIVYRAGTTVFSKTNLEAVTLSAPVGDAITVTRAQQGHAALTLAAGDFLVQGITALDWDTLKALVASQGAALAGVTVTGTPAAGKAVVAVSASAAQWTDVATQAELDAFTVSGSGTYARQDRARNGRVVALGDSTTVAQEDVTKTGVLNTSPLTYAGIFSGGRVLHTRNAGVGGQRSDQVLARFDTDVTPYSPGVVVVRVGTNDVAQSVATATIIANIAAIVIKVRSIGAIPVVTHIVPSNTTRQATHALNLAISRWCADNGVTCVDSTRALFNTTTGLYLAAYSSGDGVHPNEAGYGVMGQAEAAALSEILPASNVYLTRDNGDLNNLISGGLALVDTNADGVPNYWTKGGGSAQSVTSLTSAAGDGVLGNWMRIVSTNEATAAAYMRHVIPMNGNLLGDGRTSNVEVGDRLALSFALKCSGFTGSANFAAYVYSAPGYSVYARYYNMTYAPTGVGYLEMVVPAGTTSIDVRFNMDNGGATSSGTMQVGQVGLYNLTKLGLTQQMYP